MRCKRTGLKTRHYKNFADPHFLYFLYFLYLLYLLNFLYFAASYRRARGAICDVSTASYVN